MNSELKNLVSEIEAYVPFNEQEEKDKEVILECLKNNENVFLRESKMAHMTASAWVTNKNRDKILMVYHNLYDSWSWLGGHADGEVNLLDVAMREVSEESGLKRLVPVSRNIYSLEVLTVDGHIKKGEYISSHLHLNVTYLLEADDTEMLSIKPDENSGVAWFGLQKAIDSSTEQWFQEHIYSKLNEKLRQFPSCDDCDEKKDNYIETENVNVNNTKIENAKIENTKKENTKIESVNIDNTKTENAKIENAQKQRANGSEREKEIAEEKIEKKVEKKVEKKPEFIYIENERIPVKEISIYGISTEQVKTYVKIYEKGAEDGKRKSLFSSPYGWKGKKQKLETTAEEYFDRAIKIARTYGASAPTKTILSKDGKVLMYCKKAGKLNLEEDFIETPMRCFYIEMDNGDKKQFFEERVKFDLDEKRRELDSIFSYDN